MGRVLTSAAQDKKRGNSCRMNVTQTSPRDATEEKEEKEEEEKGKVTGFLSLVTHYTFQRMTTGALKLSL